MNKGKEKFCFTKYNDWAKLSKSVLSYAQVMMIFRIDVILTYKCSGSTFEHALDFWLDFVFSNTICCLFTAK